MSTSPLDELGVLRSPFGKDGASSKMSVFDEVHPSKAFSKSA